MHIPEDTEAGLALKGMVAKSGVKESDTELM
jgi:hypothetical protein